MENQGFSQRGTSFALSLPVHERNIRNLGGVSYRWKTRGFPSEARAFALSLPVHEMSIAALLYPDLDLNNHSLISLFFLIFVFYFSSGGLGKNKV